MSRIVYDGHQSGDRDRGRLDGLEIEPGLANEPLDPPMADHVGLQVSEQPSCARRHLDRRRHVDELRAMQVELGRAPPGDVERLDVRVVAPHARPASAARPRRAGCAAGSGRRAAAGRCWCRRQRRQPWRRGPGASCCRRTPRSASGKHLDADAIAAAHHLRRPEPSDSASSLRTRASSTGVVLSSSTSSPRPTAGCDGRDTQVQAEHRRVTGEGAQDHSGARTAQRRSPVCREPRGRGAAGDDDHESRIVRARRAVRRPRRRVDRRRRRAPGVTVRSGRRTRPPTCRCPPTWSRSSTAAAATTGSTSRRLRGCRRRHPTPNAQRARLASTVDLPVPAVAQDQRAGRARGAAASPARSVRVSRPTGRRHRAVSELGRRRSISESETLSGVRATIVGPCAPSETLARSATAAARSAIDRDLDLDEVGQRDRPPGDRIGMRPVSMPSGAVGAPVVEMQDDALLELAEHPRRRGVLARRAHQRRDAVQWTVADDALEHVAALLELAAELEGAQQRADVVDDEHDVGIGGRVVAGGTRGRARRRSRTSTRRMRSGSSVEATAPHAGSDSSACSRLG